MNNCCVVCDSQIAQTNMEGLQIILESRMTVTTIAKEKECLALQQLGKCLPNTEYQLLINTAKQYLEEGKKGLAFHDRYGQTSELQFVRQKIFNINGSVPIGNVIEVIGRKEDEVKVENFLRACADESVKVYSELLNSNIDIEKTFDTALIFSLEEESFSVIKPTMEGLEATQFDLPHEGKDRESLIFRVISVLKNDYSYRSIIIENIAGIGIGDEREEIADPFEWINVINSYVGLADKWLIIGMILENNFPYAERSPEILQEMVNYKKDYDSVKILNFAREYAIHDMWDD